MNLREKKHRRDVCVLVLSVFAIVWFSFAWPEKQGIAEEVNSVQAENRSEIDELLDGPTKNTTPTKTGPTPDEMLNAGEEKKEAEKEESGEKIEESGEKTKILTEKNDQALPENVDKIFETILSEDEGAQNGKKEKSESENPPPKEEGEITAKTTLPEQAPTDTGGESTAPIDRLLDEKDPGILIILPEPEKKPKLKERKLEREINLNPEAPQYCRAEEFNMDITGRSLSANRLILEGVRVDLWDEKIEVGSLPQGIDLFFSKNNGYFYAPEKNEAVVDFLVTVDTGAQRGNFSVIFVYDASERTAICQINIINTPAEEPATTPPLFLLKESTVEKPTTSTEAKENPTIDELLDPAGEPEAVKAEKINGNDKKSEEDSVSEERPETKTIKENLKEEPSEPAPP